MDMKLNKTGFGAYGTRLLGPVPEQPSRKRQRKTGHKHKRPELVPDHAHIGTFKEYIAQSCDDVAQGIEQGADLKPVGHVFDAKKGRGRNASRPAPPAQIRT